MPPYSVLAAFAMKVFILVIAVHCALFFRGAYFLDESFDEIQREEDKLPHYLKDDGIRRVAKLTKRPLQQDFEGKSHASGVVLLIGRAQFQVSICMF